MMVGRGPSPLGLLRKYSTRAAVVGMSDRFGLGQGRTGMPQEQDNIKGDLANWTHVV